MPPCLVTWGVDPLCGFAEQPSVCGVRCKPQVAVVSPCLGVRCRCVDVFSSLCSFALFPSGGRRENKHHTRRRCMCCRLLCHHWTVVHTTHVQGPTCCNCLPVGGGRASVQGSCFTAERKEPQILSLPSSGVCLLVRMSVSPPCPALPSCEVLPVHACPAPADPPRPSSFQVFFLLLCSSCTTNLCLAHALGRSETK